jgi:hypothetical protein
VHLPTQVGLKNLGASDCYANAVIQAIRHTRPIREVHHLTFARKRIRLELIADHPSTQLISNISEDHSAFLMKLKMIYDKVSPPVPIKWWHVENVICNVLHQMDQGIVAEASQLCEEFRAAWPKEQTQEQCSASEFYVKIFEALEVGTIGTLKHTVCRHHTQAYHVHCLAGCYGGEAPTVGCST